jgi:hypothetical protein
MAAGEADASTAIQPGQSEVVVNLTISYAIR